MCIWPWFLNSYGKPFEHLFNILDIRLKVSVLVSFLSSLVRWFCALVELLGCTVKRLCFTGNVFSTTSATFGLLVCNQTLLVNCCSALVILRGSTSRHVSCTSSLLDTTSSTKMPTSSTTKAFLTSLALLVSTKMSISSTGKVKYIILVR